MSAEQGDGRVRGPVEILCREIEFDFDRSLERQDLYVGFVAVLVGIVSDEYEMSISLSRVVGTKPPTDDARQVLARVQTMLRAPDAIGLIKQAVDVHDFIHEVAPEDAHPCDHLIDMLSSCVSAVRFGLEVPCQSRHAAEAAYHIWRRVYGIRREDRHTPAWRKHWARAQLQTAMGCALLTPKPQPRQGGAG